MNINTRVKTYSNFKVNRHIEIKYQLRLYHYIDKRRQIMSLLNLINVPNGEISGLDSETLDFVTQESNDRYVSEIDSTIFEGEPIPDLSPDLEEYLQRLEKEFIPKSTSSQNKRTVERFRSFLQEKKFCTEFENVPTSILNNYLRLFYASLRKQDGKLYAPQSLICFRAALQRHLTSPDINRQINIIGGEEFRRANGVLKSLIGMYLRSGSEKRETFESIDERDLIKIKEYFNSAENTDDKTVLQQRVLFDLLFHFQFRGRENLRFLTKDTFGFDHDSDGTEFVHIKTNMMHKNVKASLNAKDFTDTKKACMYSTANDCPVKAFKKYLSFLPEVTKDNVLFPQITKNGFVSSSVVMGKDKLGNFMSSLSKKLNLRKNYSNHCLRVTGINLLHRAGFSNSDICAVSGHKNERSLHRYMRCNEKSLKRASWTLSSSSETNEEKSSLEVREEKQFSFDSSTPGKLVSGNVFNNCSFNFYNASTSAEK